MLRQIMLIVHFIGIAMGVGTGFAFMFLGIASSKMEPAEGKKFMLNAFALARMGQIGLGLLIISGGYLITPYLSIITDFPLLIAKLTMVLVLLGIMIANHIFAKKVKQGQDQYLKKLRPLGTVGLLTSLTIVVLAVLVFK